MPTGQKQQLLDGTTVENKGRLILTSFRISLIFVINQLKIGYTLLLMFLFITVT